MFDFKPILLVIGILLTTLGCAMIIPAMIDLGANHSDWMVFAASSAFTLFTGVALAMIAWGRVDNLNVKQAFLLTTSSWVALVAFAALPFAWGELDLSYTDAFFEAMSGLTTTGATIITGLDDAPPGLLIWRALLQWLGGIGIIVMAIAVLPMLQVGGMQLFRMESSDTSEKILPRATQIAGSISLLYLVFTIACAIAYFLAGMGLFDAVAHAFTTISTGGFSTHDASMGSFNSSMIDSIAITFMILGSLPFVLYLQAIRGHTQPLFGDSQIRWFLTLGAAFVAIAWGYQIVEDLNQPMTALRLAGFNVISIMTGTGYATTDYGSWGTFTSVFFFCLMFVGGCAGSTSCGIKIFRFQVIAENVKVHINRMLFPHGVFVARYNERQLPDNVSAAVMSFFFLFFICFGVIALILNIIGLDNLTAMSAAASAIANVGPGLGSIVGPAGTYATLPDSAKWILSFAMLLGRLELFTVLVLFMPAFWRA